VPKSCFIAASDSRQRAGRRSAGVLSRTPSCAPRRQFVNHRRPSLQLLKTAVFSGAGRREAHAALPRHSSHPHNQRHQTRLARGEHVHATQYSTCSMECAATNRRSYNFHHVPLASEDRSLVERHQQHAHRQLRADGRVYSTNPAIVL
jgi:hypothetical protein